MPKVLHVFKKYHPESFGGVQQAISDIADGTIEHGYVSKVFSLSCRPQLEAFQVSQHQALTAKQHIYFASTGFSFSAFEPFERLAAEADIIHYHFPWPFMDLMHFFSRTKKPTIVTYHADIVKQIVLLQFYKPLMHRFFQSIDMIVATSPNNFQNSSVLQKYRKKTVVIPLGISEQEVIPNPSTVSKWRAEVGDDFFLFLGALRYYKGLPVLLEAARETGLPVVIAGTGDQEAYLRSIAPNNVVFTGK